MNKRGQLVIVALAVLVLVGISAFFILKNESSSANVVSDGGDSEDVRVINIDAEKFQYSPEAITVKKGERVRIVINNKDFNHGMVIPDLGVSGIDSVEFTADKEGTFEFKCPTPCGNGHKEMKGILVVQ